VAEGERLQLIHEAVQPDPLGKRRIDVHRLACDPAALLVGLDVVQRPHIVQPVGELDQQHPDVVGHRQQELAQILGGAFVLGLRLDLRQLGHPIDEPRHAGPKQPLDLFRGGNRVLDRVVEDAGGDRLGVELQFGEDARDFDRMAKIGVAGRAELRPVRLHRKHIGAVEQVLVGVGVVREDAIDEFVLAQHLAIVGWHAEARNRAAPNPTAIRSRDRGFDCGEAAPP
jgi:hypothetical protein